MCFSEQSSTLVTRYLGASWYGFFIISLCTAGIQVNKGRCGFYTGLHNVVNGDPRIYPRLLLLQNPPQMRLCGWNANWGLYLGITIGHLPLEGLSIFRCNMGTLWPPDVTFKPPQCFNNQSERGSTQKKEGNVSGVCAVIRVICINISLRQEGFIHHLAEC